MRKAIPGLLLLLGTALTYAAPSELVVLDVQNMTCPACSITIEKALDRLPGMAQAKIDTRTGTVVVRFDPERTTVPTLIRAITDAGFPARQKSNGD